MGFPVVIDGSQINTAEELKALADDKYNADAMFQYAEMMFEGDGVKQNGSEAVWRFEFAALLGNSEAFGRLGECYKEGIGVRRNSELATTLFQAGYASGSKRALLDYANLMLESDESDMKEVGYVILKYASLQGDEDADYYIEEYYPEAGGYDGKLEISDEEKKCWVELGKTGIIEDNIKFIEKEKLCMGLYYNPNTVRGNEFEHKLADICKYINQNQNTDDDSYDDSYDDSNENADFIKSIADKNAKINMAKSVGVSVGTVEGIVSNASTLYDMGRLHGTQPHGHAAERANHLMDLLQGKAPRHLGGNNAIYGPDRSHYSGLLEGMKDGFSGENATLIQTKYCHSASASVGACFDNGNFLYMDPKTGNYMHVEVPSDQYEEAVELMAKRWRNGELPGITEEEAKDLVIKGRPTYQQALRLAKAGTIESIGFDAINGAIVSAYSFGITAIVTYALSVWNGVDRKEALNAAVHAGIKSAGTAFVTAIVSAQLNRAVTDSMVGKLAEKAGDAIFRVLPDKAGKLYVEAMKTSVNIYGTDSMENATAGRIFKNQAITCGISIAILSAPDVFKLFRGKISGKQFVKNTLNNTASVAGASLGQTAGKMVGRYLFGPVGGWLGGLAGAAIGGSIARSAAGYVLDEVIEDDSKEMLAIVQRAFFDLSQEYILNKDEADVVAEYIKQRIDGNFLEKMYASHAGYEYAYDFLQPLCELATEERSFIEMPPDGDVLSETRDILSEMYDELQKEKIA